MEPILSLTRASVFVDGTLGEPRLKHPEGVAVDRDGNVWCGGEGGELYRIAADGSRLEVVASTGGFTLGIAFDRQGRLYSCDLGHKAIFRLDPATGRLDDRSVPLGGRGAAVSSTASVRVGVRAGPDGTSYRPCGQPPCSGSSGVTGDPPTAFRFFVSRRPGGTRGARRARPG